MVIRSKDETKRQKFIDQGAPCIEKTDEWTYISLRIPKNMLALIDAAVEQRPGLSRNAWVLEKLNSHLI